MDEVWAVEVGYNTSKDDVIWVVLRLFKTEAGAEDYVEDAPPFITLRIKPWGVSD